MNDEFIMGLIEGLKIAKMRDDDAGLIVAEVILMIDKLGYPNPK